MSEQTANTELLRLQCLQALGITVYHPRFRLPGAKPSVLGVWPEAETTARIEVVRPAAAPVPQQPPKSVEPTPTRSAAPSAKIAEPSASRHQEPSAPRHVEPSAPQHQEPSHIAAQNFQLLFLQVDEDLALLNQIPALARPQLQDKQLALLTSLLRWLGKPAPLQAPRVFRWPLPGLEHMAGSMSADTSLLHFLEQASSERGFRFLLQLGPQAAASGASAWQAFSTHSLDEMLTLPALKREAWQNLLPLHALLHAKA